MEDFLNTYGAQLESLLGNPTLVIIIIIAVLVGTMLLRFVTGLLVRIVRIAIVVLAVILILYWMSNGQLPAVTS